MEIKRSEAIKFINEELNNGRDCLILSVYYKLKVDLMENLISMKPDDIKLLKKELKAFKNDIRQMIKE